MTSYIKTDKEQPSSRRLSSHVRSKIEKCHDATEEEKVGCDPTHQDG